MPRDLPPYSGNTQCPKCGSYRVGTTWHAVGYESGKPCENRELWGHLCRTCPRCGFGWVEATIDASEDAPPGLRSLPGGAGR